MKVWLFVFLFMLTSVAYAQQISPAIDFLMHDMLYDALLRDHFRFEEPNPLRIEYWYVNWLNSKAGTDEYRDYLDLEGKFPLYRGSRLKVDIPFQYYRVPVWAENRETAFGSSIHVVQPNLMTRWKITDRLKSIAGWEYSLKGDGANLGKSRGRAVSLLKGFLSYDLHEQINLIGGISLDRYYYDIDEEWGVFKLANRLYCRPAAMLNWHPDGYFTLLLGIPDAGVQLALGEILKAEIRAATDRKLEVAVRSKPIERTSAVLRFLKIPCTDVPIKSPLAEKLFYTGRSVRLEIGYELNPAALASLGLQYGISGTVKLKDSQNKDIVAMDGKPYFAVGFTFTVNIEAFASTSIR